MKKLFSILCAAAVLAGISGCGDNKTKNKLVGTAILDSGSINDYTDNPMAASLTALYKASFAGAGAGDVSLSDGAGTAPRRYGAPSRAQGAPSADEGIGLGTLINGEYVLDDPILGMTVTVAFKRGVDTVYMAFEKVFDQTGPLFYTDQFLTSPFKTVYELAGFFPFNPGATLYLPTVWIRTDNTPIAWYPITGADVPNEAALLTLQNSLQTWMMDPLRFPDSMVNRVTGSVAGGELDLTMTGDMSAGRPTNTNPMRIQTTGGINTITFPDEVWNITADMQIGDNGPISGFQSFTSDSGKTGTLTFNANGSMEGIIKEGAVDIATITINSNGTGTFTDLVTGQTYNITDARP